MCVCSYSTVYRKLCLICWQDKKLVRKLDWALIPWLSFLYLICRSILLQSTVPLTDNLKAFLDRTNIGNAKVDGLQQDLGMTDAQYNSTLTIFFVSYSVFEPLTNVLLKKLRPSIFLPLIMVSPPTSRPRMILISISGRLGNRHVLHGFGAQL